jgi:hypothetical protein
MQEMALQGLEFQLLDFLGKIALPLVENIHPL